MASDLFPLLKTRYTQLDGWKIVVEYNVDGLVSYPLKLQPVDSNPNGKYWLNR